MNLTLGEEDRHILEEVGHFVRSVDNTSQLSSLIALPFFFSFCVPFEILEHLSSYTGSTSRSSKTL